jgi:hypothetical protein
MLARKVIGEWVDSGVSGLRQSVREIVADLDSFITSLCGDKNPPYIP